MSGFHQLKEMFGFYADADTLAQYDIVVPLTQGGQENDYAFVGNNGEGEIIKVDPGVLDGLESFESINTVSLATLAPVNAEQYTTQAAVAGAQAIMANYDVYNASGYSDVPFDKEHPQTATANMLPDIHIALMNVTGDLLNSGATARYTDDGLYDGVDRTGPSDLEVRVQGAEAALEIVKVAGDLKDYTRDLREKLAESDLDASVLQNITAVLNSQTLSDDGHRQQASFTVDS